MQKSFFSVLLITTILFCLPVSAYNSYYADAEIADSMELTTGYIDHDWTFAIPVRLTIPMDSNFQIFGQAEFFQEEFTSEDLSTFALGIGGRYQFYRQTQDFPVSVASQFGYMHRFEKTKEIGDWLEIVIDDADIFNAGISVSRDLEAQLDFSLIPYAGLDLHLSMGDDSDFDFTGTIGAKSQFAENWTAHLEIILGTPDGFGFGVTYMF